jgi:hypothetical protein
MFQLPFSGFFLLWARPTGAIESETPLARGSVDEDFTSMLLFVALLTLATCPGENSALTPGSCA